MLERRARERPTVSTQEAEFTIGEALAVPLFTLGRNTAGESTFGELTKGRSFFPWIFLSVFKRKNF